ncbi:MAG: hypothetical protein A2V88_16205 [Elusimicrobia bacterium RBG_16_66_12]|nr:MAG: hypothetical protein A2V88_16205 [Elusimicrobia bacterium RBG_16_66_12]
MEKCSKATDDDLRKELAFLVERERRNLAALLTTMGEYSYRRLYRDEGYYSMFEYCLRALKFDESSAYRHITAARVVRQYPEALPMIASGDLPLTSVLVLAPVLTEENRKQMFKDAKGKTRRELETMVAGLSPLPPRMDYVQRLPATPSAWAPLDANAATTGPLGEAPPGALEPVPGRMPQEWQAVMPVSLDRVRIGFDAAVGLMTLVDRARQVLRHKHPEGRLGDVLTEALEVFLDRKDPQKRLGLKPGEAGNAFAPASRPLAEPRFLTAWRGGRYIAARVKRAVWQRDDGRCAWRFEDGRLCGSRDALEFDHFRPFAKGGRSDDARNVRLLCRLHNGLAAKAAGLSPEGASSPDGLGAAGRCPAAGTPAGVGGPA